MKITNREERRQRIKYRIRKRVRGTATQPRLSVFRSVSHIYLQMLADQRGGDTTAEDIYAEKAAETCVGYLPPSEEIAGAVVFFCSPLAKCVTGTALPVNGGHFIPPVT